MILFSRFAQNTYKCTTTSNTMNAKAAIETAHPLLTESRLAIFPNPIVNRTCKKYNFTQYMYLSRSNIQSPSNLRPISLSKRLHGITLYKCRCFPETSSSSIRLNSISVWFNAMLLPLLYFYTDQPYQHKQEQRDILRQQRYNNTIGYESKIKVHYRRNEYS